MTHPTIFLLDIEGTTTPISFVYEVLFPYARQHVAAYLDAHWGEPDLDADLKLFRADLDRAAACPIPDDHAGPAAVREALAAHVRWQMDQDLKTTALKSLQGRIWRDGYHAGHLLGQVFDDVPAALQRWTALGHTAAIYSSGSVEAQKLLFAHTPHGDLTPHLKHHFDTTTGPKRDPLSYLAIARSLGAAPADILFATDITQEADAARAAGLQTLLMLRPGNHPQPPHDHPTAPTFDHL